MAVTTTRALPAQFIEDLGQDYGKQLAALTQLPVQTGMFAPTVAAQDPLQTAAYQQATDPTAGLGAYQPYLAKAGEAATAATGLTGPMTAQQRTDYMSPYQADIIDKTLAEYDVQAGKGLTSLGTAAIGVGGFGGGRHGVAEAEYQSMSDRNRALLQAQMLQQGYGQAQQARQQDYSNVMNLAQQTPALAGQQIAGLGALGGGQQAYQQSLLDASRTGAQMATYEPQQRLGTLGAGITGLMGGTSGFGTQISPAAPQSSPLASALGIGATLAGIYGMGTR